MIPAFIVTLISMLIRIIAFFTAKSNFTHKVSRSKKAAHKLVTHGIYSILRHPSYTGFFYYTVASMVLIGNWVSAILFGLMLSVFFDDRIQYE
jgi:protein-S-isoprenylcysteine O-methyltransferase